MTRRAHGDGSIYFDEKRERWVGQLDLGRRSNGRRKYRRVTARTKSEVGQRLREIRAELDLSGAVSAGDLSFTALLDSWLDSLPGKIEPDTVDNYRRMTGHLIQRIGTIPAGKVAPDDIETVLADLAKKKYARSTLVRIRGVAGQAFTWGMRRRLVTWNPAAVVEIPRKTKQARSGRALNADETRRLIDAASDNRLGALFVMAITTGMRPSELTALRWADVDLDADTVRVWRAWKGQGDQRALGDTKNAGSRRSLRLATTATDALRKHRKMQTTERLAAGPAWPSEFAELVFVGETGHPLDPSNLRKLVKRVAKSAKIEGNLTPYDLRHTSASLLSDSGVSNEVLADHFGHKTTRMLEMYYRHRVVDVVDVAADPMDRILADAN